MFYFKILISLIGLAFPLTSARMVPFLRPPVEMSAFFMTVVAIGTGVMIFQGETGCFYVYNPPRLAGASPDYNPSQNYPFMPVGCKISNGLSVTVLVSALFTFYAIMLRYDIRTVPNTSSATVLNAKKNKNNAVLLWWGNEEKEGNEQSTLQIQRADNAAKAEYCSSVVL